MFVTDMFTKAELDRLIHAMRANAVTSLEVDFDGMSLQLNFPISATPTAALPTSTPPSVDKKIVKSPCIGRFLPRGEDDGLNALNAASAIQTDEILGYISHGTARTCVLAPVDGKLVCDIPQEGAVFGYGDTIFSLDVAS